MCQTLPLKAASDFDAAVVQQGFPHAKLIYTFRHADRGQRRQAMAEENMGREIQLVEPFP